MEKVTEIGRFQVFGVEVWYHVQGFFLYIGTLYSLEVAVGEGVSGAGGCAKKRREL